MSAAAGQYGDYASAAHVFGEVLETSRHFYGDDAPSTITARCDLGQCLRKLGRLAEAAPLLYEALEGRRLAITSAAENAAPDDALVVVARNAYAQLLLDAGEPADAEREFRAALASAHAMLERNHSAALVATSGLALALRAQGRRAEATPLLIEDLEASCMTLGVAHPDTLASITNYCAIIVDAGRLRDAERLLRSVLTAERRTRGSMHPETLVSAYNLAEVLERQCSLIEAEELYREAADGFCRALGDAHAHTLRAAAAVRRVAAPPAAFQAWHASFEAALRAHPATVGSRVQRFELIALAVPGEPNGQIRGGTTGMAMAKHFERVRKAIRKVRKLKGAG